MLGLNCTARTTEYILTSLLCVMHVKVLFVGTSHIWKTEKMVPHMEKGENGSHMHIKHYVLV